MCSNCIHRHTHIQRPNTLLVLSEQQAITHCTESSFETILFFSLNFITIYTITDTAFSRAKSSVCRSWNLIKWWNYNNGTKRYKNGICVDIFDRIEIIEGSGKTTGKKHTTTRKQLGNAGLDNCLGLKRFVTAIK